MIRKAARFTAEGVGEFGVHSPSEVVVGGRFQKGLVVFAPAMGVGLNGEAGTPRLRGLLSLSVLQPAPVKHAVVEPLAAPEVQVISLPDSVFANLGQVAGVLAGQPALRIRVEIHAQAKWSEEEGAQRIAALGKVVTDYLISQGIDSERISLKPKGVTGADWIDLVVEGAE